MKTHLIPLTERELATVQAALRLWGETDNNLEELPEYFTEYSAMTWAEIAGLMDRIESQVEKLAAPHALVRVEGGVAEITADPGVETLILDFDNDPDAVAPPGFAHLAT